MSKSTRLAKAIEILAYIARHHPEPVTTKDIAASLGEHPARVRQLVSRLVKNDILVTTRGSGGGSGLAIHPAEITLEQVFKAVEESSILAVVVPNSGSCGPVAKKIQDLFDSLETKLSKDLSSYSVAYFQD